MAGEAMRRGSIVGDRAAMNAVHLYLRVLQQSMNYNREGTD
jgi:hypothetical protein